MDEFGIDLDKVLDEFEEREGRVVINNLLKCSMHGFIYVQSFCRKVFSLCRVCFFVSTAHRLL